MNQFPGDDSAGQRQPHPAQFRQQGGQAARAEELWRERRHADRPPGCEEAVFAPGPGQRNAKAAGGQRIQQWMAGGADEHERRRLNGRCQPWLAQTRRPRSASTRACICLSGRCQPWLARNRRPRSASTRACICLSGRCQPWLARNRRPRSASTRACICLSGRCQPWLARNRRPRSASTRACICLSGRCQPWLARNRRPRSASTRACICLSGRCQPWLAQRRRPRSATTKERQQRCQHRQHAGKQQ
ncbi:hypothetical protein D3C71_1292650 [compost metagenome]